VFVAGPAASEAAQAVSKLGGVSKVFFLSTPHALSDTVTQTLLQLQKDQNFSHLVSSVGAFSRDVLPRLAALLDVQPVTDVIAVKSESSFLRPIYAGNALSLVESSDSLKILTVRPTAFPPQEGGTEGGEAVVSEVQAGGDASALEWVKDDVMKSDKPQLGTAKTVVSGGRGMKNSEGFQEVLEPLCSKLGAAMGATRAAVDAGFVPNDMQVGQTGKVVAPDLYVAVGISGAIQHLAGMKDSKTIVAINKDPEAPIFQVADYGLTADLFQAVPEMTERAPQQQAS